MVPASNDDIVRTLGTDGGAICENPATALGKGLRNDALVNGADFGRTPTGHRGPADRRRRGDRPQTYCPDKLQRYLDKINKLKLRHRSRADG